MKTQRILVVALTSGMGAVAAPALANSGHFGPLDELVVTAGQLLLEQPAGLDQALDRMTGVMARVNSRGESVVRVRGAEERQTAVFIDGAPAAVPWDGRLDLGVLPVGLIGRVEVVKGAAPIEYGTNAVSAGGPASPARANCSARRLAGSSPTPTSSRRPPGSATWCWTGAAKSCR
jgi:outer membrane receptor protein involved in Fe transport